jgi:hypothetical protein
MGKTVIFRAWRQNGRENRASLESHDFIDRRRHPTTPP